MSDLIIKDNVVDALTQYLPEHTGMLENINKALPEIKRKTSLFNKRQSQFMDNMLTVSHLTPVRNVRQILAEVEKASGALKEAYWKNRLKENKIKRYEKKLAETDDEIEQEYYELKIGELMTQLESSQGYISGAIRKIDNYVEQMNSICKEYGIDDFNEIDFEKEEERYHIMKAFEQGINAARAKGGHIDEGNQIYMYQLGINGAAAQMEVTGYMMMEREAFKNGGQPSHEMLLKFLNDMADKYSGSAEKFAKAKGMTGTVTEHAALKQGDMRLIK